MGRGCSDWLLDPDLCIVPQCVSDLLALLARLNAHHIDCVGSALEGVDCHRFSHSFPKTCPRYHAGRRKFTLESLRAVARCYPYITWRAFKLAHDTNCANHDATPPTRKLARSSGCRTLAYLSVYEPISGCSPFFTGDLAYDMPQWA